MNNGMLNVVLVLVAVFMILTAVNVAYKKLNQKYVTETAYLSTGTDSEQVQGVYIRDESVITYDGEGVVSYEVADGGKLGIGSVIANVYASENQIELQQRIDALKSELALLERISNPGTTQSAQPSGISELFNQNYKDFLFQREQEDFADLQSRREDMLVLLSTYQLVTSRDAAASFRIKIEELRAELDLLEESREDPLDTVIAEDAAYFVSYADGYEDQLRLEDVESLTPEMLASVRDNPGTVSGTIGKLIENYQWVLAATVDNSSKVYQIGAKVWLKFASAPERVRGVVTSLNTTAGAEKTVVGITCEAMSYDLVQHRTESVEIIRDEDEYKGVRVPREALHFAPVADEEGNVTQVRGVYVLSGEQPEFRQLDVIYEGSDYLISKQTAESGYLHLYDAIITKGIDADGQ